MISLLLLRESFEAEEFKDCVHILDQFKNSSSALLTDFHNFILSRSKESELFKYWNNFLILTSLMNDLIRADRIGDWKLHIKTVHKLQPIFHVMSRSNYARWSAVYLEDMMVLEKKAPEVYEQFLKGRFTVKRSDAPFTSVSTDQALEQTINRSSKETGGIIGSTKKKEFVAA